jgi:putative ABC transport system substrate-binding protein
MISSLALAGVLALGIIVLPAAVEAQQPAKIVRIGYLTTSSLSSPEFWESRDAFLEELRERGWVEGRNITIVYRAADGRIERLPEMASELVRLGVDVIMAGATPAARAAQRATSTIPIVAGAMGDPVGDGLVASLARPGGNVTGTTFLGPELVPKRLELLKEALPSLSRVAALWHPGAFGERATDDMLRRTEAAARTLGVSLQLVEARSPDDLDQAFTTMARERAEALVVMPSAMLFTARQRLVELAAKHRLPAMFNAREFVRLGGLIAYGARLTDLARRGAAYVDEILRGARPGALPVEQPTSFELAVNLKTARALGLKISPALLLRADLVIE